MYSLVPQCAHNLCCLFCALIYLQLWTTMFVRIKRICLYIIDKEYRSWFTPWSIFNYNIDAILLYWNVVCTQNLCLRVQISGILRASCKGGVTAAWWVYCSQIIGLISFKWFLLHKVFTVYTTGLPLALLVSFLNEVISTILHFWAVTIIRTGSAIIMR